MTLALLVLAATPWASLDGGAVDDAVRALHQAPLGARVLDASAGYLGVSYVLSPLGEGAGKDPDPLLRHDAVDCQTFVEQVMALALTPEPAALVPTLSAIRYGQVEPSYNARHHVVEAQWIPANVAAGRLKDVARQYGGKATRTVRKRIDAKTWAEKSGRALGLPEAAQVTGEFTLDVIPAADAVAALAKAPSGLVLVVVRADRPWIVTRVSHMGLLVHGARGPLLRHASKSFKRVVDEPLERYLSRNLEHGAWTVEGLAVFEVTQPPG